MRPSFVNWVRNIGYFPYFFLADISILMLSVGMCALFFKSFDALIITGLCLITMLIEYGTAYYIYRRRTPYPSGVFYMGSNDPFYFSKEEIDSHIDNFGMGYKGKSDFKHGEK